MWGGSATVAAVVTIVDRDAGGTASIAAGAALIGYIVVEIAILNQPSWTKIEAFHIGVGASMAILGGLVLAVG